jgi:septal ring factor EnvC (AmiA/AmiB activator)
MGRRIAMKWIGKTLKWTAVSCFLLAGAVFIFGQARVTGALCAARDRVSEQFDDIVGQEAQIREEIRRLQAEYPKHVAELQFSLHQVDEDISELVNDCQLCTKVVALCDKDLDDVDTITVSWSPAVDDDVDMSPYETKLAERRLTEIQQVRERYAGRKQRNEDELISLRDEHDRLASALSQIRDEQQQFETELNRLYRELDSLERNRTLIKLAERRDTMNVSRYADSVESLRQLRAKIERTRIEQEERLNVLRMHRRNAEYEARAVYEIDNGKDRISLAITSAD